MVNKIATRIQSRLSRKGLKVTLGDIKTVYIDMVLDPQNPTDEEVDSVTNYFVDQASKLATVSTETTEEDLAPVASDHSESDNLEPVNNLYTSVDNQPEQEEEEIEPTVHTLSTTVDNQLGNQPTEEDTPGAIAPVATSELVASTAEVMGISLNLEDVTAIASNFDYASTNSDDELEEIKSAITAFVQHKAALSRQKINHIVEEVKDTIRYLDNENSDILNKGLREISQDIKSGSERFRQQTRQALKVFALPPSKAG